MTAKQEAGSFLPWFMWGLTCCFYFFEFFLQVSPSVMVPQLMHDFSVSAHAIGSLSAFYFYTYAVMQIPAGILLDRFGARKLLAVATVICALGSICFGMAEGVWLASIGRALIGFGGAFAAIGSMSVVAVWHPSHRFALLTGCLVGFGMFGAIFGASSLALVVNQLGWRHSMMLLGYLGLGLGVIIWFFIQDREIADHIRESGFWDQFLSLIAGLKSVLLNQQLMLISLYGCFYFATTSAFGALWGVPYLMLKYQISNTQAGTLIAFVFAGWMIGSPLGGYISERLRLRQPIVLWTSVCGTVLMGMVIYLDLTQWMIATLLFLFGLVSGGMILIFSMGKENASLANVATAMGVVNCLNMIGGAALQPGIGALLDHFWQGGRGVDGVPIYTVSDYHAALALLPITLVISLIFIVFVRETYGRVPE